MIKFGTSRIKVKYERNGSLLEKNNSQTDKRLTQQQRQCWMQFSTNTSHVGIHKIFAPGLSFKESLYKQTALEKQRQRFSLGQIYLHFQVVKLETPSSSDCPRGSHNIGFTRQRLQVILSVFEELKETMSKELKESK